LFLCIIPSMIKEKKTPPITVIYGSDPVTMTELILSAVQLGNSIPKGSSIGLKPNLVVPRPATEGGTTTPEIIEGIIRHLHSHGHHDIRIMESSWTASPTKKAFKVCGYQRISETYDVPLINLEDDEEVIYEHDGESYSVCASAIYTDILINVPVLKGHCQTHMTGALKNLKGCIPDSEKRRYHRAGLHKPIADLQKIIRPDWIVMDALRGDLGFENGGNPSTMHRMMVCRDPVLLDSYCCTLLDIPVSDVPYITRSAEAGVGELFDEKTADTVLLELNSPEDTYRVPSGTRPIPSMTDQRDACSSCYGALVKTLLDLDDRTFGRLLEQFEKNRSPLFAVGQAFSRNQHPEADQVLGIGSCTSSFPCHARGCPPTPEQVKNALERFFPE